MLKKVELIEILNEIASPDLAENWDNCGFQIDMEKDGYNKILISLEITNEVIEEAINNSVDLIITHHPLLFSGVKSISNDDMIGSYVIKLIKNNISVFSMHTNFDKAEQGNNKYLSDIVGLKNTKDIRYGQGKCEYMGCYGELEDSDTLQNIAEKLKKKLLLGFGDIRIVGNKDLMINKVALCTGAGAEFIEIAKSLHCDLYITGDIKYHDAQKAKEIGLSLIDAGHYGTEAIFAENLKYLLEYKIDKQVEIIQSKININPFTTL